MKYLAGIYRTEVALPGYRLGTFLSGVINLLAGLTQM